MSQQLGRAEKGVGLFALECLPEDVLCQIIKHLSWHDKCQLQLVSRKLYAVMLNPPEGEGLWGECDLSALLSEHVKEDHFIEAAVRR